AANTPNAKQATMNAIREERRRAGAYSDIKAVAIGTAPPRPRLVITRQAINTVGFDARVTPRVVSPMTIIIAISVGRRPNRSASGASRTAPRAMPISDPESAGAKAGGGRLHSSA